MRLNQYVARATGISRRAADTAIDAGRVQVNGNKAKLGSQVQQNDAVVLDGKSLSQLEQSITIMLNKPAGYVCSRNGQGNKTIYELLPAEQHNLKPIGRLDKDTSGLLLLTNDGQLAQKLTHPSYQKRKVYEVELDKGLSSPDKSKLERGIKLNDGPSHLTFIPSEGGETRSLHYGRDDKHWTIMMHEGRNRQIRRTFGALGYNVTKLHRTQIGDYGLGNLKPGKYAVASA